MPKETIRDVTVVHGTSDKPYIPAVNVWWGKDQMVQIASVNLAAEDATGTEHYGWHVDMDRTMINKLIKALRRARDQAYGADE